MDTNLKKTTLKKQINIVIIVAILFTVLLVCLLNTGFLEKLYLVHKENSLEEVFNNLETAVKDNTLYSEDYVDSFVSICENQNVSCMVIRPDGRVMITTEKNANRITGHLYQVLFSEDRMSRDDGKSFFINRFYDEVLMSEYLSLWGSLSDGNTVFMETTMQSIRDPLIVTTRFIFFAGIVSMIFGIIISTILTSRILKPLKELTEISEKMSNLEFDIKYAPSKKPNEIDLLGIRMNDMSSIIEDNIKSLKQKNFELSTDIRLKEKNEEMRREFISNVSHELKTPISLILGYAEGLLDDELPISEEKKKHYTEVILEEAEKMDALIVKLLELNELEYGKENTKLSRVDIGKIVNDEVFNVLLLAKNADVIIDNAISPPIYVWTDEFLARLVIDNYLTNAIRYANGEHKIIKIYSENVEKGVKICIYNTGEGISEEDLPRIWDKFYKADKAHTRTFNSSGIGLSIVKAAADSLNCEYGVRNLEGGVEFYFVFDTSDS